jgi:Domain of unknown function (DUF6817)
VIRRVRSWLESVGAGEIAHPGGTLLAHLVRTQESLARWGGGEDLQVVALCHASYGTDGFEPHLLTLDQRAVLVALTSPAIEAAVYRYASCDRAGTYPTIAAGTPVFTDRFADRREAASPEETRGFMELTAANELDVCRHSTAVRRRYGRTLADWLLACSRYLSPPAQAAVAAFARALDTQSA